MKITAQLPEFLIEQFETELAIYNSQYSESKDCKYYILQESSLAPVFALMTSENKDLIESNFHRYVRHLRKRQIHIDRQITKDAKEIREKLMKSAAVKQLNKLGVIIPENLKEF